MPQTLGTELPSSIDNKCGLSQRGVLAPSNKPTHLRTRPRAGAKIVVDLDFQELNSSVYVNYMSENSSLS